MGNYVAKSQLNRDRGKTIYTNLADAERITGEKCIDITGKNLNYYKLEGENLVVDEIAKANYESNIAAKEAENTEIKVSKEAAKDIIKISKGKVKDLSKEDLNNLIEKILTLLS